MVTPGSLTPLMWRFSKLVVPFFTKYRKECEIFRSFLSYYVPLVETLTLLAAT